MLVASEKDMQKLLISYCKKAIALRNNLPRDNYETVQTWPNKEPLFSGMNTIGQGLAT